MANASGTVSGPHRWLTRLLSFTRRDRGAASHEVPGLLSIDQTRALLDHERSRADRTGRVFCLLVFGYRQEAGRADNEAELLRVVRRRLRGTDAVGRLEEGRIGLLLHDTPPGGALRVVEDVFDVLGSRGELPHYEIYRYPAPSSERLLASSEDQGVAAEVDASEEPEPQETKASFQTLEELFIEPTPWWKRSLDIVGGAVGTVVSAPLLAAAAVAIRLTSPGPILFCQQRSGIGGKPFTIYKLRTMYIDAEARQRELLELNEQDGPAFKLTNDPRITPVGRILRVTSIDELPQFWNILKGDMSLVGPRPLPCHETDGCEPWQRRRLLVKPGLTCIWQIEGRSKVTFAEWVRMDIAYIRARTPVFDLALIARTFGAVVGRTGK